MYIKESATPPKHIHYSEIPIIINNFNRLEYLQKLLDGLEQRGYQNIHILDNQSTYTPLLDFYKTTKYKVHFLDKNYGFRALWKSKLYHKFKGNFFVYTDSDLEILEDCPNDFLEYFREELIKNRFFSKIGFSLKIDDLPDHYSLKDEVIKWETQFYKNKKGNLYKAAVDTTFALYRPFSFKHLRSKHANCYRTALPYQMRHLPWYVDHNNLSEEELFYLKTTQVDSWVKKLENEIKTN